MMTMLVTEVTICWRGTREGKRVQPSGATAADLKCDVELARCVDIINSFYKDKGRKKDSSIVSTFHWLSKWWPFLKKKRLMFCFSLNGEQHKIPNKEYLDTWKRFFWPKEINLYFLRSDDKFLRWLIKIHFTVISTLLYCLLGWNN